MRWLQDLRTIFDALDARMNDEHWANGSPEKRARTAACTVLRNLLQGQVPHQKTGINLLEMADEPLSDSRFC